MVTTAGAGVDLLLALGLPVEVKTFADADIAGRHARLRVRQTPPSPSMVAADRGGDVVVYVIPRLTESLARIAETDPSVAVVATDEGVVIWDTERFASATTPTEPAPTRGRMPWARFGLLRSLVRTRRPRTQIEIASETGVTQAAVSQNLKRMPDLATRTSTGWVANDPARVAASFLEEYPGPGGIAQYWYGIDPVVRQASMAARAGVDCLLSGDAAADLVAPWRTPRTAIVYARSGLKLAPLGFAEAAREKGTLAVIVPADPTIWPLAAAYAGGWDAPSNADPLLCAYDIRTSGGADADQASERLVQLVLARWSRGD